MQKQSEDYSFQVEAPMSSCLSHASHLGLHRPNVSQTLQPSWRCPKLACHHQKKPGVERISQKGYKAMPGSISQRSVCVHAGSEELQMEADELEMETEERMEKTIDSLKGSLNTVRTGRANPSILDRLEVDYYGAPTPLKSLAGVGVPDAETLLITPYDKGAIQDIERAISLSDIGLTPNNDGEKIRLVIPQLTKERRVEMSKVVAKMGEESKVALRNIRRDAIKGIGKLELPEDNEKDLKDGLQKLTDKFVTTVDEMVKNKEKELTTM